MSQTLNPFVNQPIGGLSKIIGKPSVFFDFANGQYGNSLANISLTRNSAAYFRGGDGALLTAGINVQRFEHDNNLKCLGLFCEGVNQNVCLQSENLGTTWTNVRSTESLNVVATTDPLGGNTADKIEEDATTGQKSVNQVFSTTAPNQNLTFSVWVKPAERVRCRITMYDSAATTNQVTCRFDMDTGTAQLPTVGGNGVAVASGMIAYPNGWFRIWLTGQPNTSGTQSRADIILIDGLTSNYTGIPGYGIYVWGAQLQTGSILTSYVPTTTAAASSTADNYLLSGISSLIKQGVGTIFAKASVLGANPASRTILSLNDGTVNNAVTLRLNNSGLGNLFVQNGGLSQADIPAGTGFTGNQQLRIAASYANGVFSIASNGATFSTANTGTVPSDLDRISLGCLADGTSPMNGNLESIAYWPFPVSESALSALTRA